MNLLLTCAGRRAFYVTEFKRALGARGEVLACDSSADAPALRHADRGFVVPDVADEGYVDSLLELCERHRVGLLVPILEPELPLLADAQRRFAAIGTRALVSSPQVVATCYDKLATARFLTGCGIAAPRTFCSLPEARAALARGEVRFPLVVKPRWGVGSIGLAFAETAEELAFQHELTTRTTAGSPPPRGDGASGCRVLIQERVIGVEHGADVINDLDGRHVRTLVRRKLRMRGGQTDRAVTVRHEGLEALGRLLGERLGHTGPVDCDIFVDGAGRCIPIDINPRIGGGYPFCHLAGANLPAALIAWSLGERADPSWLDYQPDVTVSRFDDYVVVAGRAPAVGSTPWTRCIGNPIPAPSSIAAAPERRTT